MDVMYKYWSGASNPIPSIIWELEPLDDGVLFQNVMRVHYNGLWWDGYGWGVLYYTVSIVIDLVVKNILIFNYLLRKKIDLFIE